MPAVWNPDETMRLPYPFGGVCRSVRRAPRQLIRADAVAGRSWDRSPWGRAVRQRRSILLVALMVVLAGARVGPIETHGADTIRQSIVPAARCLPADTFAYARLVDGSAIRQRWAESSLGRMMDDPKVRPISQELYSIASQTVRDASDEFGMSLDSLLEIPQGQIAVAVIPGQVSAERGGTGGETEEAIRRRLERRRAAERTVGVVVMVEKLEQNADAIKTLLQGIEKTLAKNGFVEKSVRVDGGSISRWVHPRGADEFAWEWFDHDGWVVAGVGASSVGSVLSRLNGSVTSTGPSDGSTATDGIEPSCLAENANFAAVMTRSLGAEAESPDVTFFVNPYRIVRWSMLRSEMAGFAWPIIQELGIEKMRGVGGSIFRGGRWVENVTHLDVVIDPPRDGFFGVVRPQSVEYEPPRWVPADVSVYSHLGWDVATAFDNLAKVVNRFAGEGEFEKSFLQRTQQRLGFDPRTDLIDNLTGDYVSIQRMEEPGVWNATGRADAIRVKDPAVARQMLAKLRERLTGAMERETIAGEEVWQVQKRPNRQPRRSRRETTWYWLVMDDWLILTNSRSLLSDVLRARAGNLADLGTDPDYGLVVAEIGTKTSSEKPFWISFRRDAESYRFLYEFLRSESVVEQFRKAGGQSPPQKRLAELLGDPSMPDFDEFAKYFGVSGMYGTDHADGLHVGSVSLRPVEVNQ